MGGGGYEMEELSQVLMLEFHGLEQVAKPFLTKGKLVIIPTS